MTMQSTLRQETTEALIAALPRPGGAAWLGAARDAALERLRRMGLPQRRDEYWRFTDPGRLVSPAVPAVPLREDDEKPAFAAVEPLRIVFVDGRFDAAASDPLAPEGVEIGHLGRLEPAEGHWAASLFGVLEAEGQKPVPRPFAALNTAFAAEGALIRVRGEASRPIHLVYRRTGDGAEVLLHHVVRVEGGASVTLLESGVGAARLNTVLEVDVAEGSRFHHVRLQGRDPARIAVTHLFARVAGQGEFRSFTLGFNGALSRNEAFVTLTGDEAVAHVAGAAVGDGDFHHDDTVFVTHRGRGCESRQVFKKVLRHGAVGVFQGKILVERTAQKTDGYQISQGLLLDERSQFLAKPELEIYADDVKCSHGSTAGAIDETALFYLRSRGVPAEEARDLLTLAFLHEALDEIPDERLAGELSEKLEGWLRRHR
ncbi:ABC-type transport system involved in Fe-S cluster assembly, permease component [Rubellimicrobium thermophilum DSM 16684]|uniref:ABC-type transport system involved in Fe-S cluster assembly, permease component n=1 Tax=Rubellimicrobium thermophilum DSM 16684 TaxID=1123069 RepID=S9R2R4_9RHOB|nr:SufD family Fe-S cluster assembly protein [Rubellimicrobium thermophilum]EPX86192.1 ABC-type transport system involved in Fe-S cluster assembly, permease component [Rubellimicrobium thermophilum DSM 16684]